MVTLYKRKTSPSQLSTNTILDKHGKPNLANGCVFQTELPWHRESIFLGSQLAAGSPFTETISSPSKTPATWPNGVGTAEVRKWYQVHGWLDFMVKALWNYQPPWNNCGWKTIVHFGMASPQGPCLPQRRHCHIWWFVLPTTSPGNATRSASREISRIGNNHDQPTIHFVWQPLADAQNVWCKGKTPTNVQNKCFKFLIHEYWMHQNAATKGIRFPQIRTLSCVLHHFVFTWPPDSHLSSPGGLCVPTLKIVQNGFT